MYSPLGDVLLKSGEQMQVGVVRGPDPEWKPALTVFLGHKGPPWMAQIAGALDGPLDGLESRFYVGQIAGEVVCHIMVVGSRGVGILGHVFTLPEQRQKGAARSLMAFVMEDSRRRGFTVLTLGTGFDSPAYWIYHGFGFRSVTEESGLMLWQAEPDALNTIFRQAPTHTRPVLWDDWAFFNLMAVQPVEKAESDPRCALLGLKGQGSVEGSFIAFQLRRAEEPRLKAQALVTEVGFTVGWALIGPPDSQSDTPVLSIHTLPNFVDQRPELLRAVGAQHFGWKE